MIKGLAVVLLSGGMDSTLSVAKAFEMNYKVAAMHLNYGQVTEERELKQFNEICDHYNIEHRLVVDINYLKAIGGSSLTDQNIRISQADLESKTIPSSYVPFRNANILSIATSWAEVIKANALFIGAVQEDGSGYPDTTIEFFKAFEKTINLGTKPETKIEIITPIISLTKEEIVKEGIRLNIPFEKTWSCYSNNKIACGECDSCGLRLRGFQKNNSEDPLEYKLRPDYL